MCENNKAGVSDQVADNKYCMACNEQYSALDWLHCKLCENVIHTACISKQYEAAGAEHPKNGIAWLYGLLNSMNFRLVCSNCIAR